MKKVAFNNNWKSFWQINALSPAMAEASARGFWKRLVETVPISIDWAGLDFGCGYGYLLKHMAGRMRLVFGIDASPEMLAIARKETGHLPNVQIQELAETPDQFHEPRLDLIAVNSCIQYLSNEELQQWMEWWVGSLTPNGKIVLSDVYPRRHNRWHNFLETLRWGWQERCLTGVIYEFFLLVRSGYFKEKHYGCDPEELLLLAERCGGNGHLLPENLYFLSTRYSLMIERKKGEDKEEVR